MKDVKGEIKGKMNLDKSQIKFVLERRIFAYCVGRKGAVLTSIHVVE